MTLHLIKLCVGVDTVEDLAVCRDEEARVSGKDSPNIHTTRMVPKRIEELLDNGSLYWVIKGVVQVRQKLLDIRPFTDKSGIRRCDLVMEPNLVLTRGQPRRAFQGWRYLKASDAPDDLTGILARANAPEPMRSELNKLCLL